MAVFKKTFRTILCGAVGASMMLASGMAQAWDLATAAKPYSGTTIKAIFLDRPGYRAAIKMLPDFEKQTGIKVDYEILPYENTREREVLEFSSGGDLDVVLIDLVWLGEFAESGWVEPMDDFFKNKDLADPSLDVKDFFPLLLDAFGTWGGKVYGLPFDNYSGLLFYNKCELKDAGFSEPPKTWDELMTSYAPKLTKADGSQFGYALQSKRGETQSADSFMRFLWPWGGSLLDKNFKSNLLSPESQAGLKARQDLMKDMPKGIVDYDHNEAVNALAQGKVAMITEWSAFYPTLTDPSTSKLGDCLGVAPEPAGKAGRLPALGGFSLAVNKNSSDAKKAASYLFIQWITSAAEAQTYLEAGGVPGRMKVYEDPAIQAKYPFVKPMVESWQKGVPQFRPRFAEWPEISEIVAEWGSKMMLGNVSIEEGSKEIGTRMEAVLQKAGYYDGKKQLNQ
ncbi:MAG TPA: sugar ABC transporter substrate-binding protein [Dongiaceae bacterium]|nr:sugar ABC transporter substrate-binding protein [Dongiaceae bacterium]